MLSIKGGLTTHSTRADLAWMSFAGIEGLVRLFPPRQFGRYAAVVLYHADNTVKSGKLNMSNVWVEFEVNVPADNLEVRKEREKKIRQLIESKSQRLQESVAQKLLESVISVSYERADSPIREKWIIYIEGDGDIKEYARGFHNDISNILAEGDMLRVTVNQDE